LVLFLVVLTLQITYGAFMAGLDAGYFFPTFPKMGTSWGPQNLGLIFGEEGIPGIVQNPFLVQFIHRWVPVILMVIMAFVLYFNEKAKVLAGSQKWSVRILAIMLLIQFILGVLTIIWGVPISLGVIHQFGAVLLLVMNIVALFIFNTKNIFYKKEQN